MAANNMKALIRLNGEEKEGVFEECCNHVRILYKEIYKRFEEWDEIEHNRGNLIASNEYTIISLINHNTSLTSTVTRIGERSTELELIFDREDERVAFVKNLYSGK